MRPDGALVVTDTAVSITPPPPQWDDPPGLTRDQWRAALLALADLPDLVGPIPAEISALLQTLLHRRDDAATVVARWLDSIDEQARG